MTLTAGEWYVTRSGYQARVDKLIENNVGSTVNNHFRVEHFDPTYKQPEMTYKLVLIHNEDGKCAGNFFERDLVGPVAPVTTWPVEAKASSVWEMI